MNKFAEKITEIHGKAIALHGDDIDTDRIMPARFLKELSFSHLGRNVFADERRQASERGETHPFDDFRREQARVLVVAKNFGCGSSREHAPQGIKRWGIDAVIGESFGEIFRGNCGSIGLACLQVSTEHAEALRAKVEADPDVELFIDLHAKTVSCQNEHYPIELSEAVRERLIGGQWDSLAELLSNPQEVDQVYKALPYVNQFA